VKAIYIERNGSPDVLRFGEQPAPQPAAGEALVKIAAAGINFIDMNHRSGLDKVPLPTILGMEGAGMVTTGKLMLLV
jgi:NADPH:quinone reductase